MGLNSGMAKIVSYTNSIVGFTSAYSSHVNIPNNTFMKIMGIAEDLPISSLSDIKQTITELKEGIAQGVNLVDCAITLATTKQGLDFLDQVATGVVGVIGTITDQIIQAVAAQVSIATSYVIGTITNVITAFQNLISSIMLISDAIKDLYNSWSDWSNIQIELELERDKCADMYAAIAGCLLNKFLGSHIEKFTEKVVGKINEVGNNFNDALYDELQDANVFASYAKQEAFLLKKASIQMKGLTKENLLGSND